MQDTRIEPQDQEHMQADALTKWATLALNAIQLMA